MIGRSRYDAIVIGGGLGGGSLAYKLAAHGVSVLVVERGDFLRPPEALRPGEPPGRYRNELVGRGRPISFIGGATKFYGAALYRMRESDFREVRHEAGISPAWPLTYAELEPFYAQAERLFRVHGSSDGDPSEPSRCDPYPYPAVPHDPVVATMAERLRATGTRVSAIPVGLDYGPQGKCRLCTFCDGHFCQIDAKMDAEIALLRPALRTGFVELATGAECLRVRTDVSGTHVSGADIRIAGTVHEISAGVVAVACGCPGTALLLRRSRNATHPEGLGNNGGALGRYLGGHHAGFVFPSIGRGPEVAGYTKTFGINSYYEPSAEWPYPTGLIQMAGQLPLWKDFPPPFNWIVKGLLSRRLAMFYMVEAPPTREAGVMFDGDSISRRVLPPRSSQTFARLRLHAISALRDAGYRSFAPRHCAFWHEVGTARMGEDPATSVTDRDGMVHGIRGLYVADASTLPSAGAVNTALTIAALALRTGSVIVGGAAAPDAPQGKRPEAVPKRKMP